MKKKYVKVSRPDSHGPKWCLYRLEGFSVVDEFDGAEIVGNLELMMDKWGTLVTQPELRAR